MNIEDAARVIYKMMKCEEEEDCSDRTCGECKYCTRKTEEKDARKVLDEYFSKEQYINISYDRTGDDAESEIVEE